MSVVPNVAIAPRKWQRSARRWTALPLALAPALVLSFLVAPAANAATPSFTDGFESGNLAAWSAVQTGAGGTATVQSATVKTGTYAARLTATAAAGSFAYARESLAGAQTDVTAGGDFQVQTEGTSGGNVPIYRLFDAAGTKLVSLYRQNQSAGIWVWYANTYNATTASLALNTWAQVQVHVVATGSATGTVDVLVNGATVYHSATATFPAAGFSSVQLGNNSTAQPFAVVADNISVTTGAVGTATPPTNTSPPTISGKATQGSTLTASPGTWSGTAPITSAYQWQRCNGAGAICVDATGATSSNYVLGTADVGATLRAAVTSTNSAGNSSAVSTPTALVTAGSSPAPTNTAPPTISGTPVQGSTLTGGPGTWSGAAPITFTYQWRHCDTTGATCSPVSGATGSTYTLGPADVGSTMQLGVTASNSGGSGVATSNPTTVVQSGSTPSGLAALWHMDETTGSVAHDSVGGHDGALHSVQLGLSGYLGSAFGFNGSSAYISVPTSSALNPASSNITITIHVNTTGAPATPDWDLIRKGKYTTTGGEFKMEYQPSGQASCGFNGSAGYSELIAGPSIKDGKWHTVQCVKTSSAIKVVVDGQTFSKTANVGSISNSEPVVIGAHPGSEFFKGSLDEASIQIG